MNIATDLLPVHSSLRMWNQSSDTFVCRQVFISVYIFYPPSTLAGASFCKDGWRSALLLGGFLPAAFQMVPAIPWPPCSFIAPPFALTPNLYWAGWVGKQLCLWWWLLVAKMAHTHHHPNSLHSHMSDESSFIQTSVHFGIYLLPTLHPSRSIFL